LATPWPQAVAKLSSGSPNLVRLTIMDLEMEKTSIEKLAKALKETKCPVARLEVSHLGDEGCSVLGAALLETRAPIINLDFSVSSIGDKGAESLGRILQSSSCTVSRLNLSGNYISDSGVKHLADRLLKSHSNDKMSITALDLSENEFGDLGARYIAEGLRDRTCQLLRLDIGHNNITLYGTQAILEALLARRVTSRLSVIKGLDITKEVGERCGIPNTVVQAYANRGTCEGSCDGLLRWVHRRIKRANVVLPILIEVLGLERISSIAGDYLFWKHALTKCTNRSFQPYSGGIDAKGNKSSLA